MYGGTVLVNTVAENRSKYTVRAYSQAVAARKLQDTIGRPSDRDFKKIVAGESMRNCPIVSSDIVRAEDIFGKNLGSLKGKTVRQKGDHVPSLVADVPYDIIKTHKLVTLCFDIMFVNKIAFLVTVSRNIRFGTTERLESRHAPVVAIALLKVLALYRQRGFRVKECNGDGEFEVLRGDLADAHSNLNVASEGEHVPEIERCLRVIKERARSVYNTVPFKRMPNSMVVELVHWCNFWLNMFPAMDGVSSTLSPRCIMTGQTCDFKIHCRLQFGEYAQVHESHDNSMLSRTTGAIALRPTGNIQGGHYFMSLSTGRRLNRSAWTPLPMPGEVIERVQQLARRNPAGGALEFGWRNGEPIEDGPDEEDDGHDDDYNPDSDDESDGDSDDDNSYDADPPHPVAGVDEYDDGQAPYLDGEGDPLPGLVLPEEQNESDDDSDEEPEDQDRDEEEPEDQDRDESSDEEPADDENAEFDNAEEPADDENAEFDNADDAADGSAADDVDGAADDATGGVATANDGATEGVATRAADNEGVQPEGVPPEGVAEVPQVAVTEDMDQKYGVRRREGMRSRRKPQNASDSQRGIPKSAAPRARMRARFATNPVAETVEHHSLNVMLSEELFGLEGFSELENIALTQFNLKQGLERFGKAAADAVYKEMLQLHDRKTILPR
jgi:hypothetical protein